MKEAISESFVPKISYCVYKKCGPNWRIQPQAVVRYDITYIIKGNARYTIDKKVYELGPGDLLCLAEGVEIEAVSCQKNPMRFFSVSFNSHNAAAARDPLLPMIKNIGIRKELVEMFREMTLSWSNKQDGYIMKTRALLMLILHRLNEILVFKNDNMTGDYRINKITRFIAAHYSDKLTVKALAEMVNLNKAYLGRLFKKQTGISMDQYITKIRIQNAETMLQSGGYKVHEVAEHCGFSDVFHFYKLFRATRGFSPSRCKPTKKPPKR